MLTTDLLRARSRGGEVRPSYLPTTGTKAERHLARAEELMALWDAHVGRRRGELDDAVQDAVAGRPDFKIDRGLAKLLEDRSTFRGLPREEAASRRQELFAAAASARRTGEFERSAVVADVAARFAATPEAFEAELYGDLKENEVLESWRRLEPGGLLDRYNLALAQAVLLRALTLDVTVRGADPPRLRQLLRHVKFHGLLQEARRDGPEVRLRLDGPLSIFSATPRYGVKMAGFLPALLLCEDWELDAQVQLGRGRRRARFRLTPDDGLRSHRADHGAWLPELIEAFGERFAEVAPDWEAHTEVEVLSLGGEPLVPDFQLVHRESGWTGWLEVLGYWRKGAVARRLQALTAHGAPRLVLALDRSLKVGEQDVQGLDGPVVSFREVPDARKVRKHLERLREADEHAPARP